MGFEIVFDRWDAGEWDALATRFASANIYQSWHYAQMHSHTIGRTVGRAALLDAGQVLAMVHLPTYDNNLFSRGITDQELQALLGDARAPLLNGAIGSAYSPGSTFEAVTATAALHVVTLIPDFGTVITMATGTGGVRVVCKPAYGVEGITAVNASGVISLTRHPP